MTISSLQVFKSNEINLLPTSDSLTSFVIRIRLKENTYCIYDYDTSSVTV